MSARILSDSGSFFLSNSSLLSASYGASLTTMDSSFCLGGLHDKCSKITNGTRQHCRAKLYMLLYRFICVLCWQLSMGWWNNIANFVKLLFILLLWPLLLFTNVTYLARLLWMWEELDCYLIQTSKLLLDFGCGFNFLCYQRKSWKVPFPDWMICQQSEIKKWQK